MSLFQQAAWNPTQILRWIRSMPTSTGVAVVATDQGEAYLKAMGNPEGEHALVCELVGTLLARWLGLPTLDFSLIEVTDTFEIPLDKECIASPGPAFITRSEKGDSWGGSARELRRLINQSDLTKLVILDTWTLNCDRYCPAKRRRKLNNVFLSQEAPPGKFLLRAIDHTCCFTCGRPLTPKQSRIDLVQYPGLLGCFPEFRRFLNKDIARATVADLKSIDRSLIDGILDRVPRQWQLSESAQSALGDFILRRAGYVAEHIIDWLWRQKKFDFAREPGDKP